MRVHTHSPATQETEEDHWSPQAGGQHRQHRVHLAIIIASVTCYNKDHMNFKTSHCT